MDKTFVKLSELDGQEVTIEKVHPYKWKLWDPSQNKMLVSEEWQRDYKKRYGIDTDKGFLEVSQMQLGKILEATFVNGTSSPAGHTLLIKGNGKTGLQADYWFNQVKQTAPKPMSASDGLPYGDNSGAPDLPEGW